MNSTGIQLLGPKPKSVLLIEDSVADQRLFRRALQQMGRTVDLEIASDGASGLQAILGLDGASSGRRPAFVVLDLNLPELSGCEVLEGVRAAAVTIPIVIMSSSRTEKEIEWCYRVGCNAYVCKPMDPQRYQAVVRVLIEHWIDVAVLPGDGDLLRSR